jgi:hypothetical protein
MKSTSNASQIYRHFKQLPGSQYMANEKAIKGLVKWLKKRQPKAMLEVGAGIGTLTFASVSALSECWEGDGSCTYRLISIEDNPFCLSALKENLRDQWGRFELIRGLEELSNKPGTLDFVIIDGGNLDPNYCANLSPRAVVFVEGYMNKQRELIGSTHKKRKWVATNFRSLNRKYGYWIFQFEPSLSEVVWFTMNNLLNRTYSAVKRSFKGSRLSLSPR